LRACFTCPWQSCFRSPWPFIPAILDDQTHKAMSHEFVTVPGARDGSGALPTISAGDRDARVDRVSWCLCVHQCCASASRVSRPPASLLCPMHWLGREPLDIKDIPSTHLAGAGTGSLRLATWVLVERVWCIHISVSGALGNAGRDVGQGGCDALGRFGLRPLMGWLRRGWWWRAGRRRRWWA